MKNILNISVLLISLSILTGNSIFGQSIQELQTLQRLLRQNGSNTSVPDQNQLEVSDDEISETKYKSKVLPTKLNYSPKKGNWLAIRDYSNWLNETNGDTSVMELFGFILDTSLTHFGYNIFTQRDSITYWQYLPAPDSYILGPGDEIEVSLWGETQLNTKYKINRDGNIYIEKVGLISLSGRQIGEAKNIIKNKFKQNFATLRGNFPSSYIDITFAANKTINVHFVGEVNLPGIHQVHPFSSILTGLIQAGGVKLNGSLRTIYIKRDGEIVSELDLYDYLINGNISTNVQLRENDVVVIPFRKSSIEIDGAVYRTGIYEALRSENLAQLIEYAGGLKSKSSGQITLTRILPLEKRNNRESNIRQYLYDYGQLDTIYVQDGDKIQIHTIGESVNEVQIWGQVKRSGAFQYTKDMDLQDLLELAGGLEDSIFINTMHLDEVELIRKNKESIYNKTIIINLKHHLDNGTLSNIKLDNQDLVIVRTNKNYLSRNNVLISGEVNYPGAYALKEYGETLESLVNRAGGFTNRAFIEGMKVSRDTLNIIVDNMSFPVISGDSVHVNQKMGVVHVKGEVYNPGLISFANGRSINSYIAAAGGLTPDGYRRDILLVYANGEVKQHRFLFKPKVREGATIVVNKKPDRQPFSVNEFLRDSASIAASLAMIYYVVQNK